MKDLLRQIRMAIAPFVEVSSICRTSHYSENEYIPETLRLRVRDHISLEAIDNEICKYFKSPEKAVWPGWNPISTAPQDGTPIEFLCPDGGFDIEGPSSNYDMIEQSPSLVVKWSSIDVFGRVRVWQLFWAPQDGEYNYYPYVTNATHWRPYRP